MPGAEKAKVIAAISAFNDFLERGTSREDFQCNQAVKISSSRIRDSVHARTVEHVLAAYTLIHSRLTQPENGYDDEVLGLLKSTEMVKNLLAK